MSDMLPLVRFHVQGRARTKGHLEVVNSGRRGGRAVLRETNRESERWRRVMVDAARNALSTGQPAFLGPVVVRATWIFSDSVGDPTEIGWGDLDTLQRNLGDALSVDKTGKGLGAEVIGDDSQIVAWVVDKMAFSRADPVMAAAEMGIMVAVWPAPYRTSPASDGPPMVFSRNLSRGLEDAMFTVGNLTGVWYGC